VPIVANAHHTGPGSPLGSTVHPAQHVDIDKPDLRSPCVLSYSSLATRAL
jgi:hypothetical protein